MLNTEIPDSDPAERTIMRLLRAIRPNSTGERQQRRALYLKTTRALRAYLDGEDLQVVKAVDDNYFPLPCDLSVD